METQIGRVTHYFSHLHVAALALSSPLKMGDRIHIAGHSTDLIERVTSMEVNHHMVVEAEPGMDVAVKVIDPVHVNDAVYLVETEEIEPHAAC